MTDPQPEHDIDEMEETVVVTMVDEEGAEQDFALLDMIEVDGRRYGLFAPAEELVEEDEEGTRPAVAAHEEDFDDEEEDDDGILVLRAVQRGGEEDFEIIEDEAEFNSVLDHLEQMASNTQLHFGTSVNNN